MIWLAIIGAIIIGLVLGLLGSGGSVLTLPILVYLIGEDKKVAVAESLAIVGSLAAFGAIPSQLAKQVDWRSVLLFAIPGMIGTVSGAMLAKHISGSLQLVLFGVVMFPAAFCMYRNAVLSSCAKKPDCLEPRTIQPFWQISLEGFAVGNITGLVGVGGGFLIIPALVLFGGLPMRKAVGTSLVIIAMQSLSGFTKHYDVLIDKGQNVNWSTIIWFVGIGIVGILVGQYLATRIHQNRLKKGFAVFLLVMAVYIFIKEIPALVNEPLAPTSTSLRLSDSATNKFTRAL